MTAEEAIETLLVLLRYEDAHDGIRLSDERLKNWKKNEKSFIAKIVSIEFLMIVRLTLGCVVTLTIMLGE